MRTATAELATPEEESGWRAELALTYAAQKDTTILADSRHQGPLRVQRPLYPEGGVCHTCILHPPGGVVGGDSLHLDVTVRDTAHALITTPGATKFYRSAGRAAVQRQMLAVHGGTLEWLPQEAIAFPGAEAELLTEVRLYGKARFIGWEVLCLGLPARGETFSPGRFDGCLALYRDGRPLFFDRLRVRSERDLASVVGLRRHPVSGCFLATGVSRETAAGLGDLASRTDGELTGLTLLGEVLVARYLGYSVVAAREFFSELWARLRPSLIGRPACPPRIWAT
ncbi:MAG: urease accessory protein UreD [Desulforhopalus sp.]|nr:urease accessory protein UreD [Desulforhopalus sp.]